MSLFTSYSFRFTFSFVFPRRGEKCSFQRYYDICSRNKNTKYVSSSVVIILFVINVCFKPHNALKTICSGDVRRTVSLLAFNVVLGIMDIIYCFQYLVSVV